MNVNKSKTLCAIIPSAGQSTRMGQTKALLPWQGRVFLEYVSQAIQDSKLFAKTVVVTGHDHTNVAPVANFFGLTVIYNAAYASGMLSSLQAGILALPEETEYVLIALVDQPQITASFLQEFTLAFLQQTERCSLARVEVDGRPSPPCLIAKKHFTEILAQDQTDMGAQFLFKKYPEQVFTFQASTDVIQDIDTPEAYNKLINTEPPYAH